MILAYKEGLMKTINLLLFYVIGIAVFIFLPLHVVAQPEIPSPEGTDPISLKLMQGFPVPQERQITAANFYAFPKSRWAFHHLRQLKPSSNIWRGREEASVLITAARDLGKIEFEDDNGRMTTIDQWQTNTFTDALMVLHKGIIVYEQYYHTMRPELPSDST